MLKRKEPDNISPLFDDRYQRRRLLSSSSSMSSPGNTSYNGPLAPPTQPGGQTILSGISSSSVSTDPTMQSLLAAMTNPLFMNSFIPILSMSLGPLIHQAVQSSVKDLIETVHKQQVEIDDLKVKNASLNERVDQLEGDLEELEQYGRRNSLRFHNIKCEDTNNTDAVIAKLCKDKLDVTITEDDICRSHPVGRANRHGNYQLICRFRNWKLKNKIYMQKKKLKGDTDRVFITEDLTKFRQEIISEIDKAKRCNKVHSYWTMDGRIFIKLSERGQKHIVTSIEELHDIAPPQ